MSVVRFGAFDVLTQEEFPDELAVRVRNHDLSASAVLKLAAMEKHAKLCTTRAVAYKAYMNTQVSRSRKDAFSTAFIKLSSMNEDLENLPKVADPVDRASLPRATVLEAARLVFKYEVKDAKGAPLHVGDEVNMLFGPVALQKVPFAAGVKMRVLDLAMYPMSRNDGAARNGQNVALDYQRERTRKLQLDIDSFEAGRGSPLTDEEKRELRNNYTPTLNAYLQECDWTATCYAVKLAFVEAGHEEFDGYWFDPAGVESTATYVHPEPIVVEDSEEEGSDDESVYYDD